MFVSVKFAFTQTFPPAKISKHTMCARKLFLTYLYLFELQKNADVQTF